MSCSQILTGDLSQIGQLQTFNGDCCGSVGLFSAKTCWSEIIDTLKQADSFVRTKLAKLESEGFDLHSMSLPTIDEYTEILESIPDYTDGTLLLTKLQWNAKKVEPNSEVGLCLDQGAN